MMVGRREGKSIRATAREIGRSPRRSSASRAATPRAGGGAAPRPPAQERRQEASPPQARAPGRPRPALARAGEGPPGAAVARAGGRQAGARARPAGRLRPRHKARHRPPRAGRPRAEAHRPGAGGAPAAPRQAPPPPRRGGGEGASSPSPARSAGGPPSPRRPTGGRGSRTGTGRRGRRGRGSALRRPPPPGEGGRREHQRAHPRAPSQGHRLLPRHRRGGRGGVRWDQPQAAQAPGLADSPGSPLLRGVALALKIQEQMDDLGQMPSRNMLPTLSIASSGSSTPTTSPKSSTPTTMRPPSLFANATTLRAMPSHTSRFSSKRSDSRSTMMASGPARPRHAFQTRIPDTTVSR